MSDPLMSQQLEESAVDRGLKRADKSPFKPYVELIEEEFEESNGSCPPNIKSASANAMFKSLQYNRSIMEQYLKYMPGQVQDLLTEETTADNVSHFTRYGFEMITSLMPNLIATEIVNVHPMDRRQGQVFYQSTIAGKSVGDEVEEGDPLITPSEGSKGSIHYSDEHVPNEFFNEGDGTALKFSGFSMEPYIRSGSLEITTFDGSGNELTVQDDGSGNLIGDVGTSSTWDDSVQGGARNTVDYSDGGIFVEFSSAPGADEEILITYNTDFEKNTDGIPDVEIALDSKPIRAKSRKLNARWLLDAMYDLQQAHNRDAEQDILQSLTSYLRWEIDGEILADLQRLGKSHDTVYTFDAEPGPSKNQLTHNNDFIQLLTEMGNAIKKQTGRGAGNFVVAGMNASSLIENMDQFEREGDPLDVETSGPRRIGVLDGRYVVYQNPYYNDNEFVVGLRGQEWNNAGYAYAPYLPIYTTPTLQTADFVSQKGVATAYGKTDINAGFYRYGRLVGISGGTAKSDVTGPVA